jgi:hypothetical protein
LPSQMVPPLSVHVVVLLEFWVPQQLLSQV